MIILLYIQALVLGIQFTLIPAAGNFFTASQGLTTAQYSALFVPMIIAAIVASFFGGILAQHYSNKRLILSGVILNAFSLGLIVISHSYLFMLLTMTLLGAGFGATMTALNPLVAHYFPKKSSTALTAMHACIGIGMALSPLLFNFFLSHDLWWMDPALLSSTNLVLFIFGLLVLPRVKNPPSKKSIFPLYLLLFALASFLYGVIETTFGNWATLYLYQERSMSIIRANEALAIFWGSLTIGRILAALLTLVTAPKLIYRVLPLVILVVFNKNS